MPAWWATSNSRGGFKSQSWIHTCWVEEWQLDGLMDLVWDQNESISALHPCFCRQRALAAFAHLYFWDCFSGCDIGFCLYFFFNFFTFKLEWEFNKSSWNPVKKVPHYSWMEEFSWPSELSYLRATQKELRLFPWVFFGENLSSPWSYFYRTVVTWQVMSALEALESYKHWGGWGTTQKPHWNLCLILSSPWQEFTKTLTSDLSVMSPCLVLRYFCPYGRERALVWGSENLGSVPGEIVHPFESELPYS